MGVRKRLGLKSSQVGSKITACIYTTGEPTFKASLESVKAQRLPVERIEIIRNVALISAAKNEGLRRVKTEYYIDVDADMILCKDCVGLLYSVIKDKNGVFAVMGFLKDPLYGKISGVRLFRTSIMKNMEYKNIIGCDRVLIMEAIEAGFKMLLADKILGLHKLVYTPSTAYDRFKRTAEKIRVFGDGREEWLKSFDMILKAYNESKDTTTLFALLGHISGLFSELKDLKGEKDFRKMRNDQVFQRFIEFFKIENGSFT